MSSRKCLSVVLLALLLLGVTAAAGAAPVPARRAAAPAAAPAWDLLNQLRELAGRLFGPAAPLAASPASPAHQGAPRSPFKPLCDNSAGFDPNGQCL